MIPPQAWAPMAQAAAGALTGMATAAAGGPNTSAAQVDSRSWMDGSGWTVSTGGSTASGGRWGNNSQEAQQQRNTTAPASASFAPPAWGGLDLGPADLPPLGGDGFPMVGLLIVGAAFLFAKL